MSHQTKAQPPGSGQVRTVHAVLLDVETACIDLHRLAQVVEMLGSYARIEGIGREYGGGVEILGEVIGERIARLDALNREGITLNGGHA